MAFSLGSLSDVGSFSSLGNLTGGISTIAGGAPLNVSAASATKSTNSTLGSLSSADNTASIVSQFQYVFDKIGLAISNGQGSVEISLDTAKWAILSPVLTAKGYAFTGPVTTTQITYSANPTKLSLRVSGGAPGASTFVIANASGVAAGQLVTGIGVPENTYVSNSYTTGTAISLVNWLNSPATFTAQSELTYKFYSPITTTNNFYTITWATISNGLASQVSSAVTVTSSSTAIIGLTPTAFAGTINSLLIVKFKPTGGVAPYTFTVTGNVPAGTTFSSLTNVSSITLTGTPTVRASEYATLNISIVDSLGKTFSQDIDWNISPPSATVLLS